jgi:hypothetical protein
LHLAQRGLLDSEQIENWKSDQDLGSLLCETISLATPTRPTLSPQINRNRSRSVAAMPTRDQVDRVLFFSLQRIGSGQATKETSTTISAIESEKQSALPLKRDRWEIRRKQLAPTPRRQSTCRSENLLVNNQRRTTKAF